MANETLPVAGLGTGSSELAYLVPGGMTFDLMAAFATFDGSGAASAFLPALQILSPTGDVMASTVGSSVAAGGSADVTFAPFLEEEVAVAGTLQNRNVGDLGDTLGTTLSDTQTHTIAIQSMIAGDRVLVAVSAPSLSSGAAFPAAPLSVDDSQGNVYFRLTQMILEPFPATVNTGMTVSVFYSASSSVPLVEGVDVITATWDGPVYDRMVTAYLLRHDGGPRNPTLLAKTADNDAAVYAASQVTLTQPNWTPPQDNALSLALIFNARSLAAAQAAYGQVIGYTGFYEAADIAKLRTGSKQKYALHRQTHGANVYVQVGDTITTNEIDIGLEAGGVLIPAFNGVGQQYQNPFPTPEVNVWKGIILIGLD